LRSDHFIGSDVQGLSDGAWALVATNFSLAVGARRGQFSLSWWKRSRDGELTDPKTQAARRDVPLAPGLVDLLVKLKREHASEDDFVFSTSGKRPLSYWNFRRRGFQKALEAAGLAGKGITIHGLRSAAISLYAARGLTMVETAAVMGQKDPHVTWKHYVKLFNPSDVAARVRAAQASLSLDGLAGGVR
jgi:integrase